MTVWITVLAACFLAFALKLAGHLAPASWFEHPRVARVIGFLPVALLSALVVVQTVGGTGGLVADARIPALLVAIVLLTIRANFLVVVIAAAVVAGGLRALGWG